MYILSVLKMFPPICHSFLTMAPLFWAEFLWSLNFLSFFLFQARFYRAHAAAWGSENMSLVPMLTPKEELWVQVCGLGRRYSLDKLPATLPTTLVVLYARITHSALLLLLVLLLIYGFFCIPLFIIVPTSMWAIIFSPIF